MEETEYNIIIKQHSEYSYFSMNRGKNHKFYIVWNLEIGWFSNRIHAAEIEIKEWNFMVEYLGTSPLQSSEIFRNYFLFLWFQSQHTMYNAKMTTKFLFRSRYRCAAEFKDCLKFTIYEYFFGLKYLLHIIENLEVLIFKIMSHLIRLGEEI